MNRGGGLHFSSRGGGGLALDSRGGGVAFVYTALEDDRDVQAGRPGSRSSGRTFGSITLFSFVCLF